MTVRDLGGQAQRLGGHGVRALGHDGGGRRIGQNDAETEFGEKGVPIRIVLPGIEHAHNADLAHGGRLKGKHFAAKETLDFPVNKALMLFLAASETLQTEFASIAAHKFVA